MTTALYPVNLLLLKKRARLGMLFAVHPACELLSSPKLGSS